MSLRQIIDFIRLGRPLFLVGGFVFHGLGIAMAHYQGVVVDSMAMIWGQIAITSIQLATHYSNDYFDLAADQANVTPTDWSGGSRVLVAGRLSPKVALKTAVVLSLFALIATMVLGLWVQPAIRTIPLLLLTLVLAWQYSAPPLRLHSRGLGMVTVAFTVPVLTPLVGYYLQTGQFHYLPWLTTLPLACLQACMILVINIPDAAGDQQAGKHTLVIRLGVQKAVRLYLVLLTTTYLLLPLLVWVGLPWQVALATLGLLPLAGWQGWRMQRGAGQDAWQWNSLGFWSVALLVGTAVLQIIAFLIINK